MPKPTVLPSLHNKIMKMHCNGENLPFLTHCCTVANLTLFKHFLSARHVGLLLMDHLSTAGSVSSSVDAVTVTRHGMRHGT